MSTVTIRLNNKEEKVFNEYAKLHGMPLSTLLKQVLEERIKDEIDMKIIREYEEKTKNDDIKTYNHTEVMKMLVF